MKKIIYKILELFFKRRFYLSLNLFVTYSFFWRFLFFTSTILCKKIALKIYVIFTTKIFYPQFLPIQRCRIYNNYFLYILCKFWTRIIENEYYFMLTSKIFYYLLYKLPGNIYNYIYINFIYNLYFIDFFYFFLKNIVIISNKRNKNLQCFFKYYKINILIFV